MAAVLAVPLMLGACSGGHPTSSTDASPPTPTGDRRAAEALASAATGSGAVVHLQALQDIAARNGGNRATGTAGYEQSVDYVADTLRRVGFDVQTPTVPLSAGAESGDAQEGEGSATSGTTRNVIAQTRSGRTDEVVLSGAHLDSVPAGPGIGDDGSGVAAQLEVAVKMGADAPVTNAVRFVFFGAEEDGLLGSQAYVRGLSPDGRRDIAVMLNSDGLAAPNGGYFVYDGDGSDGSNTETAAPGSQAIERLLHDRLASQGVQPRDRIRRRLRLRPVRRGRHPRRRRVLRGLGNEDRRAGPPVGRPARRPLPTLLPPGLRRHQQHQQTDVRPHGQHPRLRSRRIRGGPQRLTATEPTVRPMRTRFPLP